jgi:hypothetical protein
MKKHVPVEVKLHAFLTSVLDRTEQWVSPFRRFASRERLSVAQCYDPVVILKLWKSEKLRPWRKEYLISPVIHLVAYTRSWLSYLS